MNSSILEIQNISKSYPGVMALDKVSISFQSGEVHALVGENGAGKSTLIKILAGAISPDSGAIIFNGHTFSCLTPQKAKEIGVSVIYQEFMLVPHLTVAENIFLGEKSTSKFFVDKKLIRSKTMEVMATLGAAISPDTEVVNLSTAYQQIVEIAKAVTKDCKVLIMDEPSAPLTEDEVKAMFAMVRHLKSQGITVIYISHRLEEIFTIADRVTVLRDGHFIKTLEITATNSDEIIKLMVGRELTEQFPPKKTSIRNQILLEVEGLTDGKLLNNISFSVKKGEILGLGGLVGSGRTEIARAIFGADPIQKGNIRIEGRDTVIKSPRDAIRQGIGLIPEDRKLHGVLLEMSVKDNIVLPAIRSFCNGPFLDVERQNSITGHYKETFKIKAHSVAQKVATLSGGNQQKIALAKWLATQCQILIFDEPTRGIDVGAKFEIYKLMLRLADEGKSIIMISSDMPELIGMSDRIIVMCNGSIGGELSGDEVSQDAILKITSGMKGEVIKHEI